MINRQALINLNKVGEVTSRLKELEVALEFSDLSKQRAEGEATLAKERAESAAKEVKRLELKVPVLLSVVLVIVHFLFLSLCTQFTCGLKVHSFICQKYTLRLLLFLACFLCVSLLRSVKKETS